MSEKMYNDAFLDSLPEEPLYALRAVIIAFRKRASGLDAKARSTVDFFMRSVALAEQYSKRAELSIAPLATSDLLKLDNPSLLTKVHSTISAISNQCNNAISVLERRESVMRLDDYRDMYSSFPRNELTYEFSDDDYATIQRLTNELRDLIADSELLSDNHKRRLLSRLEKFQSELHKKVSNLDHFWALFGEAGPRLGQFGEDVKPLTDRIGEMVDIVIRVTKIHENLIPDLSKSLPGNVDNSDTDE